MPAYGSKAQQLAGLAVRLGAEQLPYYLASAREATGEPAPGWYWRPAGVTHPVYLAASFLTAYVKLTKKIEERTHDAA